MQGCLLPAVPEGKKGRREGEEDCVGKKCGVEEGKVGVEGMEVSVGGMSCGE